MKEALQDLFRRLGPISPGTPAAAMTDELRGFLDGDARPDGRYTLRLHVAPNTLAAHEEGLEDREVILRGERSFAAVRRREGDFIFERVPSGTYELVAGETTFERLVAIAQSLEAGFREALVRLDMVPALDSGPRTGTLSLYDVRWGVERDGEQIDLTVETTDRRLEGKALLVRSNRNEPFGALRFRWGADRRLRGSLRVPAPRTVDESFILAIEEDGEAEEDPVSPDTPAPV